MSIVLGDKKTDSEKDNDNQIEEQVRQLAVSHSGLALQLLPDSLRTGLINKDPVSEQIMQCKP